MKYLTATVDYTLATVALVLFVAYLFGYFVIEQGLK